MTQEEWTAITNHDEFYDGKIYCACRTTQVVCRPSCLSKQCKPENAVIFYSLQDALDQGYHPCRKCCPQIEGWKGVKSELAGAAARLIEENYLEKFSLEQLADTLHVNKYYLARTFKEMRGQTLLNYHHFCRCEHSKQYLEKQELSMEMVAFKSGYMTGSHYVKTFHKIFGITPLQYRKEYCRMESQ